MAGNKRLACRIIPVHAKAAGDFAKWGGLLYSAPVIPVSTLCSTVFARGGGQIPPPLHSFRNYRHSAGMGSGRALPCGPIQSGRAPGAHTTARVEPHSGSPRQQWHPI